MTKLLEKLRAFSGTRAAKILHFFFGDPVQLYAVFLMMTSMYYYHEDFTLLYTLIALVLTALLMRFYDFVARKRFLGPVLYLIYLAAGLYAVSMITNYVNVRYPISFSVWFLTPQSVVDFSLGYTIAIFMLMLGFLTSTVYYFSKVRYRMVMQLLIMMIPLALYAKENLQMPALLVILLLSSYFLLMIYCRQLRPSEQVRHMGGFPTGISVALYVVAFTIAAAIIPKPPIEANREFIENAMAFSTWSDTLMQAISMFTDTTDNRSATNSNARTIMTVAADEPLHLRTQTYTYYTGAEDSWTVTDYDRPSLPYKTPITYKPQDLMQAILDAAAADADFAEKYGLTDVTSLTLPEQELRELYVNSWINFAFVPAPTRLVQIDTINDGDENASLTSHYIVAFPFAAWTSETMQYYSDTYVRYSTPMELLDRLSRENYNALLEDAQLVLLHAGLTEEAQTIWIAFLDSEDAARYAADTDLLDYHSDVIDDLAAQLTDGLHSDLEKALAIERYFTEAGYLYDAGYDKPAGENVDDFLSTTHRGVCYEYATAMTLLCRSAGLPARYVQGFLVSEEGSVGPRTTGPTYLPKRDPNYTVRSRDAHGFPEVYISGYGWVSFEPTVASDGANAAGPENQKVMRWGYVLLLLAVLAVLGWLALPWFRERKFRRDIQSMTPQACASAIFLRMRGSLRLRTSATVSELGQASAPFFTREALFPQLDALLYRQNAEPVTTVQALSEAYVLWDEERKAFIKSQKRAEKEAANAERARNRKEN